MTFTDEMQRWEGRVALVTGASSGIGAAVAESLVKNGMTVVGFARRAERVQALAKQLSGQKGKLYAIKGDATKEEDIKAAFAWIEDNFKSPVHVLVNNAAVLYPESITSGITDNWRQMLETNVLALTICSREVLKSMKAHGFDDGHIVNINSITGHNIWTHLLPLYTATKYAVTALTQSLRRELSLKKSATRVTSISPGTVNTEMLSNADIPDSMLRSALLPSDVADAVVFVLSLRPEVHIPELTITPCEDTDVIILGHIVEKNNITV